MLGDGGTAGPSATWNPLLSESRVEGVASVGPMSWMGFTGPPLPITVVPFTKPGSKTAFVVDASTAWALLTVGASWIQSALQKHDAYVRCLVKDLPEVASFTTIV